jgi:tetratricopeptide (TPR) repeat protein
MGLLARLFASDGEQKQPTEQPQTPVPYTEADIPIIAQSASRLAEVINESIALAKNSHEASTKVSRLDVAKNNVAKLKELCQQYPFVEIKSLPEVEAELAELSAQFKMKGYRELAAGNEQGQMLEKEGQADRAIAVYEALLKKGTDTPFTYRRLAILYRKKGEPDQELQILKVAMENVPSKNAKHFAWFHDRYEKLLVKQAGA